jgi:ribonuclease G
MSVKLVISNRNNQIITSYLENGELLEVNCEAKEKMSSVGNIYVGKVKNIVKNIQAAFIDIGFSDQAYFSLEENNTILYTDPSINRPLRIGDEIIVQVLKEGTKTKGPVVSSHLNITGRYMVLTVGKNYIGISNKITVTAERQKLKNMMLPYLNESYGFIVRTNAQYASKQEIQEELETLIERYEHIKKIGSFRSCYQLIEKAPNTFIMSIRDHCEGQLDEIIVDDQDLYEDIKEFLSQNQPQDLDKLSLYTDENLSLFDLHSLKSKIDDALKDKVWLKSGGYLVINPTEALIAIDVNTGKYSGKQKAIEDTIYKINLEASKEIAKQLRLRNLSGIIIVDFIDMKKEEYKNNLLKTFKGYLDQDPVKVTLLGMTSLNLVELTRKKIRKPIYEQIGVKCNKCSGRGYVWDNANT